MDFRQLYYFKEIVKQGSISKAAEVLHIAQPPLSQLLKKLETDLGTTLIHRYRQKWELTATGEILYQYANKMLMQIQDVKQQIQEIEQGIGGTVSIGVSSTCSNMLIDYVSMFRTQYPNVKIKIVTGNSEELLKKLEQREIDVALLLRLGNSEQYEMKILKKQPTAVIIPSSWATSFSSQHVTIEQIAQFPFIMLGAMEGLSFNEDLFKVFDEHQVKPNIIIECKDIRMVVALVSRGLGLSVIPRMDYTSSFLEHTTLFELKQFDFHLEPVIVKLKDQRISKVASQFWEMVD
ncbi:MULTISPECIES: LysR family transcriptional regulator [Bacillus cereus group]|uniref:HTH-type transcriptional regulator CzcR n=1 Tax=Bacillus toyonensis TaxID=155322 RepID=A0ABX6G5R2_9BACI|nr:MULTISPECIES: LysR family transcriptional regulator [Bacillus cereus group]AFU12537.1 Transcriptional regulator, LysR [Bacillus thuringiensis MC28]KNH40343.1 LysR family transcriptional regulator [Bacillus thuringiensis]MBJ8046949.1 LysR family transcriptional regulator [Bacillus cereus group sp. N18]MCU5177710.1 LysR family transcriptional regulator [Bacillus toyonensis]MED2710878.1 LysR family transcriptional regulator [Bacillus toyonensis]